MADGQTATNPQTGEKVVLRGGQWVPMGAPRQTAQPRASRQPVAAFPGNPVDLIPQAAGGARISSGYRDPERNRAAGGATNSYHTRGQALDLVPQNGETMAQLEARLRQSGLPLRELLNEGDHVHVAWEGSPLSPDMTADYFANGGASQPQAQDEQAAPAASEGQFATNPQTGERVQFINGQWTPVQTVDPASGAITVEQYDPELEARQADPEYQRAIADARRGSAAVPERLRALGLGGTLGFLTDINATAQGALQGLENAGRRVTGQEIEYGADMAAQAARDSEREAQAAYAAENPIENFSLQLAGGLLTPGLGMAGNYISGATGAARGVRAAQVGAGYGATSGLGYGTGNVGERLDDAAIGGLVGAGTGYLGQRGVDRLTRSAANPARVSPARALSREGVELTPGQMVSGLPVVGPVLRTLEEASSTVPIAGAMVSNARDRSVNTFNRAALNRVLEPLGEAFPTGLRAQIARIGRGAENPESGYEAVRNVQGIVSRAYDRALDGVEVRPDQTFYDDLGEVVVNASEQMTPQLTEQLARVLQNRVFRTLEESDSVLTGQAFKRAESEIGALAREQRVSLDPANRALASALDDTRDVLRDLVARQRPDRAPQIQAVNRAYSNLVPIEEATGSGVAEATEGVFTPTALSNAAKRSQTRRTRAAGEGRMQNLTAPGRSVLNSRIGDSGTATRGGVTALMSGGVGTGSLINPGVAIPTIVGVNALYSRPAQAALNAVYRATDSRAASELVQELARLAQRDPALVPYYDGAVQHVLGLAQRDTQATPQAPASAPVPSAALQRVMQ